jgi:hypothetical protein
VASLQARSPLRSAHPLFLINKLISLTAFVFLLGAGWVAVCYLRSELANRWHGAIDSASPPASKNAATTPARADQSNLPEGKRLAGPVRLVYSCAGDAEFYHTSKHLPARAERTALCEEAALERGLKPCRVCMAK